MSIVNFPSTKRVQDFGDGDLVATVHVYKSGLVVADLSKEVTSGEQMRWVCDRLEQAKKSIIP